MDCNRDNVLTRTEMEQELVNRGLILQDDQLTHVMAFFDVQGRGYVTLGDLHDCLRTFRAVRHRTKVDGQSTTSACPIRFPQPRPRPAPGSAAVTRLQSVLLTPLALFSTPAPVEGPRKRQRCAKLPGEKRTLEQDAGINCLDITDPEMSSLADYLMDAGQGDDSKNGIQSAHGGLSSNSADHALPTNTPPSTSLLPLRLVMATLESIASRAPSCNNPNGEHMRGVRGPEKAAIPSSAARVLRVLRSLQKMWRQKDRHRRAKALIQEAADEFSDEKLSAAVRLFDVDGKGHIELEDVMTVFRNARVDKFLRRRPPAAAVPSFAALGSYLDHRGITAQDFVNTAATSAVAVVGPPESCGQSEDAGLAQKRKQVTKRHQARTATTAQLGALLCSELGLGEEQEKLVLECVEDSGLVSGANLAGAVQRARGELAHQKLERLERQRGMAHGGGCGSSETESQVSEDRLTGSGCSMLSPPRHRQQVGAAATEEGGMSSPPQHMHHCRHQDGFNQSDASLVLDLFAKEGGGLRSLTGETAVSVWRGLKRRGRGLHAHEAGRSASRHLRQLLRARKLKPLQWFATLDTTAMGPAPSDEGLSAVRRVTTSSIIKGLQLLVEGATKNPPSEANTAATTTTTTTTTADEDSAAGSREGCLSSNDGSTEQIAGKNGKVHKWTKAQSSALARHLDPCGEGSITQGAFQEGLCDCRPGRVDYPDAVQLAASRRFEATLRDIGCRDVCGLFQTLAGAGRGGGDLVDYIRHLGDYSRNASRELEAVARQERIARAVAARETEVQRTSAHRSALCGRLARPENAGALSTIQKIDELMALQGRRLVVEFHQADANRSGGVDHAELKKAIENLVRPCSLLRFERKQRRERQEAAAAAAEKAETWKEDFMQKMEALDKSKASHFLEVVSTEMRHRRWQIRDIFRDVDKGKSGALGVDDLLENTHRTLGLTLERDEATALISMLDANGDKSIQCEELELALRLYRRYGWERDRWARRKPFYEEFPSLSCLFRRAPRAGAGARGGIGADVADSQRQQHQNISALSGDTKVSREDIVTALVRLRGDSTTGRGQLLWACGPNVRRRRVLLRAVRKVAHCCQAAGVRTEPALAATLAFFGFGPTDEGRWKVGHMRTVDLWHWLRLLSAPTDTGGGGGRARESLNNYKSHRVIHGQRQKKDDACRRIKNSNRGKCFGENGGGGAETVSGRLLNGEEASLLLDALEFRTSARKDSDASANAVATAAEAAEHGFFVSVPAFWDLLVEHVPGLWDKELQGRLEAEEVERQAAAARNRQSTAALAIQCAARQRQARRAVREAQAAAEEKDRAALTVQKAVRRRQVRLNHIRANKAAARIQAMERGRIARNHAAAERAVRTAATAIAKAEAQAKAELEESARRLAAATEERNAARAAIKIQCVARKRHARVEASRQRRRRQQEEAARLEAVVKIQSVVRGRAARTAVAEEAKAEAQAKAELKESAQRLAAATEERNAARAAIKIQGAARQRHAREEVSRRRQRRQQEEAARLEAVVKVQSIVRGWLVRNAAEEAAEVATLDAALAARQAKMAAEGQAGAGGGNQGRGGWRKKSVVGARGVEGMAGLQVQVPPRNIPG